MQNNNEKMIFSDRICFVPAKQINDEIKTNNYFVKKNNSNKILCNLNFSEEEKITTNSVLVNKDVLSDFETTLSETVVSHGKKDKVTIKTLENIKEGDVYTFKQNISVNDNSTDFKKIGVVENSFSDSIKSSDDFNKQDITENTFSISDNVKIISSGEELNQEILFMQKDYVEIKSNNNLSYIENNKKYLATGELKDGKFKWHLNEDFYYPTEVNVEYKYPNKKSNLFTSTKNICLIYASSELIVASQELIVKLLPMSLDGTPIKKIKIDLNQNFINPIQLKYNFNPLMTTGDGYSISGNVLYNHSEKSISKGKITLDTPRYIRTISYNGVSSLPVIPEFETLYKYNTLYNLDNKLYGKTLPFISDSNWIDYKLNEIEFFGNGKLCKEYIWEINGIGQWKNIIFTVDNEKMTNYGNEIEIEYNLSYRYDGYTGWKGSSWDGIYDEFVNDVSGEIDSYESDHEWGISESDGVVEFSVDDVEWHSNSRGLKGRVLKWRSIGEISELIIWRNNNKEIVYEKNGEIELNCESFGGICFEYNKNLKVKINDATDWIEIKRGDEISGLEIKNISWEYDGNKLIFVKDLSESYELKCSDIENQGFHYGRFNIYTNNNVIGETCYRLLGINDKSIETISINPYFYWKGTENNYVVDFRKLTKNEYEYECGKIKLDIEMFNIGKKSEEVIFNTNGESLRNLGFVEYREYFGNGVVSIMSGEVISVYFYDGNGNEVVLSYEIIDDKIIFNSDDNYFNFSEETIFKVVVFYFTRNWSKMAFRADLEKHDIEVEKSNIVEFETASEPLKVYLYNSSNEEVQFPINITKLTKNSNYSIKIDLSESKYYENNKNDKGCYIKVIVVTKCNSNNGIYCQKFDLLEKERTILLNPVVSVYENKFLPNKIKDNTVTTEFPDAIKNSLNYIFCKMNDDDNTNKLLSKLWINSNRKFNSNNSVYKTFVCCSDDLKFWEEWKEFNEEFDLCLYGKFFKLKIDTMTIKKNNEKIFDFSFVFENVFLAKKSVDKDTVYFSMSETLENNTTYMIRVKSYNGTNYSEWSNLECYITDKNTLNEGALSLDIENENNNRVVDKINFSWEGEQDVLLSNNLTTVNEKVRSTDNLIKGKEYFWQIKDTVSKNSQDTFSVNIKPPTPTFED